MNLINLKNNLPKGATPKLLAHLMPWFAPGSPHTARTNVKYDSADPWTIASQITLALACGIDGFMMDWYGSPGTMAESGHGDAVVKAMLFECNQQGVTLGICIDKGAIVPVGAITDPTALFIMQLNYVLAAYGSHPAFFTDFVMEFGCDARGVDFVKVAAQFPNIQILHFNAALGPYYTWVNVGSGPIDSGLGALGVAKSYADPKCLMGSLCWAFCDSDPADLNKCVWGTPVNARVLNRVHQGTNWLTGLSTVPLQMKYLQIVTWNDYEEGTAIEGVLSMMTGLPITGA